MMAGLFKYRGYIWNNARADLRHRYAGTGMGVVWNVLQPLALIAVYSVVFTQLMTRDLVESDRIPGVSDRLQFLLFLCAGLLPWLAFGECLTRGCNAFTDNAAYLKKLPIPEQVFVAQAAAAATLGLAISFALLLLVSLPLGLRPGVTWLLLPLPLLALQALGFAIGLLCGTLNVFFRDVGQLLGVALQIVLWTAPIVYPASALPDRVRPLLAFHPLVPPLDAIRDLFLYHRVPGPATWVGLVAWPVVVLLAARVTFGALREEIRDLL